MALPAHLQEGVGMNIEQAKAIPLFNLLAKLGYQPSRETGKQGWYLSPLRIEKRPSFHVHLDRNVWYDHGDGRGGNALDFTVYYLEAQGHPASVSDALGFLADMIGSDFSSSPARTPRPKTAIDEKQNELIGLKSVQHPALVRYLQARGISVESPGSISKRHPSAKGKPASGFLPWPSRTRTVVLSCAISISKALYRPKLFPSCAARCRSPKESICSRVGRISLPCLHARKLISCFTTQLFSTRYQCWKAAWHISKATATRTCFHGCTMTKAAIKLRPGLPSLCRWKQG